MQFKMDITGIDLWSFQMHIMPSKDSHRKYHVANVELNLPSQ